jgi:hypothetical protein
VPLCPSLLQDATCSSEGCLCHDRRRSYPSDLTDAEWAVLEPQAREVMRELVRADGRPMAHDLRAMCDAVAYVVRNGIAWPSGTPSLRTEASDPGFPDTSDLRLRVFESVRISFRHVQRRTANAVWE